MTSHPPVKAIVESEEIIQYLHPSLLHLDYEKLTTKLAMIMSSVSVYSLIFLVSSILFSFTHTYTHLRSKEKVFWNLAIIRALFGVFSTIIGGWAIFGYNNHDRDPVFGQTATSSFSMSVTVGFFAFECLALTLSDIRFGTLSRLLHVHHWFCLCGGSIILLTESGYHLSIISLALEMSTPFSAMCWILIKAGQGHSSAWKANQLLLLHTFHIRSIIECYQWFLTYRHWTAIWTSMPLITFASSYTVLIMFTFLATPYWAYKKTLQFFQPMDWNFEPSEMLRCNGHATKIE